jgi:cystathionine beta-lyase/cystathionine gamma-synthase
MPPPLETLLTRLEQMEESARAIAALLMASEEPFETAWDTANRICDRYSLPQVKAGVSGRGSAPHAA